MASVAAVLSQRQTVHRRFQQWCQREVLRDEGVIDERESHRCDICRGDGRRGRGGAHETREGREDSRDPWIARAPALGEYTCGASS